MDKEVIKLENCLKAMKKCLKIPKVENCVCFSDAFKVLALEVKRLDGNVKQFDTDSQEKFKTLKKEVEEIQKIICEGDKECLGCDPCMASAVFKAYPEELNSLYLEKGL